MLRTAALALVAVLGAAPVAALAKGAVWRGTVLHVSFDNVKVRDKTGTVQGFPLVPRVTKLFGPNSNVNRDQKLIHSGDRVVVYYDKHFFGVPHADRIIDAKLPTRPLHN